MTNENSVKVLFELDKSDWHGFSTESVWAKPNGNDLYQILNTPFFAKGVSYKDIVKCVRRDAIIFSSKTVEYGGHSTYRTLISERVSDQLVSDYLNSLEKCECSFESMEAPYKIIAIDVPPHANIYDVYRLLQKGEEEKVWGFDEGHCGHST